MVAIRDGKTSSEMVVKQNYADRLDSIGMFEDAHDEFAVLDKAGRVQIPRELLEQLGVKGNKEKFICPKCRRNTVKKMLIHVNSTE